jgi:AcrR family transcriptional regulator
MPYPARIDADALVTTAWDMIAADGLAAFSMHALARHFGVQVGSLYRYTKRDDLLRAVNERTYGLLFAALAEAAAAPHASPTEALVATARAYRAFAHANPQVYGLAFTNTNPAAQPDDAALAQAALPYQRLMARHSGEDASLPALRGLLAIMHGWAMLELAGQLRRGGDLTAHYEQAVRAYLAGWA